MRVEGCTTVAQKGGVCIRYGAKRERKNGAVVKAAQIKLKKEEERA